MSQLVAVQSLAFRVAAPLSGQQQPSLGVFGSDMPRPVPLQRWDADDGRLAGHSARFGGFMEGAHLWVLSRISVGHRTHANIKKQRICRIW